MAENKKCWACKRTLVGDSKMGLCPDCMNKYGSVGAVITTIGVAAYANHVVKKGGKIINVFAKIIKR